LTQPYSKFYIKSTKVDGYLSFGKTKDRISIFVIKNSHEFTFVV